MNRVFVSTTTFAKYNKEPLEKLKKKNISYALNPHKRKLSENEIKAVLKKGIYTGLIAGTELLTRKALAAARGSLKVISRVGAGMDSIDLDAARRMNIKVYNTPRVLIDSVTELTIGLIISSLRRIGSMDRNIRNKLWKKEMGLLFKGKKLGIIGFGKIGQGVAGLARAFGAQVIFSDIRKINHNLFEQLPLKKLLKDSDIISIHSSSKDEIISNKELSSMKKKAILVNTARGSAVNEEALYAALKGGKIAFAALDVFSKEPYQGKLARLDNTILTPHIGSYAREARIEMEKEAVENLIKGFKKTELL